METAQSVPPTPASADGEATITTSSHLAHLSLNPTGKTTILLIHGAFCTSRDWDMVIPHLSDTYHLLVPDLPGHGQSASPEFTPFSIPHAARLLSDLITAKAHHGTAYVVGHSLGAKIAIRLATHHAAVVSRVLVSGFEVFPTSSLSAYMPHALWTMQRVENCIPRAVIRWLLDGTDLRATDTRFCTLDLCKQICAGPADEADKWPKEPWPAPTLVIAAGKSGMLLPTADHPHDAKKLAGIGKQMNEQTRAVTHPLMRHPWPRQDAVLFAAMVHAWEDSNSVPDGFVDL